MNTFCTGKDLLKRLHITKRSTNKRVALQITLNQTAFCDDITCDKCKYYKVVYHCGLYNTILHTLEALNEKT